MENIQNPWTVLVSFNEIKLQCNDVQNKYLLLFLYALDRISIIGVLYSIFFLYLDKDIHIIQQASRAKKTDISKYKRGLDQVDRQEDMI